MKYENLLTENIYQARNIIIIRYNYYTLHIIYLNICTLFVNFRYGFVRNQFDEFVLRSL